MHLTDESVGFMGATPVVGDGISMAVGSAMAFKLRGTDDVAVAFFGDAAVETGQFWEAANFSALHQLPVLFICENNMYATATHICERQPATPIFERVKGFMSSSLVSDDDVANVYAAAESCRNSGPGFLEISTYRFREHVGPNYDWDEGFRTKEEVMSHMERDPLDFVKNKLKGQQVSTIESDTQQLVQQAFKQAIAAPWPVGFQQ